MIDTSVKGNGGKACFSYAAFCRYGNAVTFILIGVYFFIVPFILTWYYISDPALKQNEVPKLAISVHRSVSGKYEKWAQRRIDSGTAKQLGVEQISATEWPMFGTVFYLWATDAIQQAWERDKSISDVEPRVYAAGAIEASAALIADEGHAAWVKQHWGDNYLHEQNVFYRMLLIGGLTSYQKLTGDDKYEKFLRDQVETLSIALDESKLGLLDDYPGQCYPTDVVAAIAAIKRADEVLGTDHSAFIKRSVRGFESPLIDDSTGLVPYFVDIYSASPGIARGCSTQWLTVWAAQLWPEHAAKWYKAFDEHFWQEKCAAAGFREFSKGTPGSEFYMDVDSGPVLAGHGVAASAFGIGAARANGRFDHAYPLSTEAVVISWPLVDGTLFGARFLSNMTHAPYLGEACLLFSMTRSPAADAEIVMGGKIPSIVYIMMAGYALAGMVFVLSSLWRINRWRKTTAKEPLPLGIFQAGLWVVLIVSGATIFLLGNLLAGTLLVLLAQFIPRGEKLVKKKVASQT